MNIKVKRSTSYTVEHDGREFEVQHQPHEGSVEIEVLSDGTAIIGYLCQDNNCPNPLEDCDGMGHVWDRRDRNSKGREEFEIACGIDRHGEQVEKPNPHAVLLDVYEHSGTSWSLSGEGMQCQWDTSKAAGVWVPDDECIQHIVSTAIEYLMPEGCKVEYKSKYNEDGTCITRPCKPGEASYFKNGDGSPKNTVPDERYNNVITYTLPDGRTKGGYKTFHHAWLAVARVLGISLNKTALERGEKLAAEKCARGAVESLNKWLSGDCWGFVVEVHGPDGALEEEYEACWGLIGSEYAEEERDSYMKAAANKHAPKATPEDVKEAEQEFAQ